MRIVIDPVTRIEGHLRIEVKVDGKKVVDAYSSGTMFRGIEIILKGRDPRDAWVFTQRICGVCTTVHATASVRAVENALKITIPDNARIIRNLITGIQFIQDHVIHFYHLHALDWVDILSALKADPSKTAILAQTISDWHNSSKTYFKEVQDKLKALAETGQIGPFTGGYWGHPEYKLTPEANLMAVAHYLEALQWQREVIKIQAILGAKNPHAQTYLVGGMAVPIDPNTQSAINADSIAFISKLSKKALNFVKKVYIPDLIAICSFYKEWVKYGEGVGNYLAYGEFPKDNISNTENLYLPRGVIFEKNLTKVYPVDHTKIEEYVTHSWYRYPDSDKGLHPYEGITDFHYTGPQPPYEFLNIEEKYSWLKAPRYDGKPMEVGPLARMLVAYANGHKRVKEILYLILNKLKLDINILFSTLGRTIARGIETIVIAEMLPVWIEELIENLRKGDLKIHNSEKWDPSTWPRKFQGYGLHEAPRGALGHWVKIKEGRIENYQCVVPSTWNCSPRDANGQPGPCEAALLKTPLQDPKKPIEILRTIHSFDPCIACAVHLFNNKGKEITKVKIRR